MRIKFKPSGIVPKKLSEEKVLDSWSILVENGQGKGMEVYNDFLRFLEESNVPEIDAKLVKVVPGWLKGLFGKEREYLMATTERLGYKTNSYISDVESGHFIPSKDKLKKIAKALDVSFKVLEDMLLESRLEALGIREPDLLSLFKDVPSLPEKDKKANNQCLPKG